MLGSKQGRNSPDLQHLVSSGRIIDQLLSLPVSPSSLAGRPFSWQGLLRLSQVATGSVVPFTGLLTLLDSDVESEIEPFETAARTVQLKVGRVAIGARCDVIDDVRDLAAKSGVEKAPVTRSGCPLHAVS